VTTDLGELLGRAATYSGPLACDTETDEIHWWRANVGVVSFAWGMGPDEQFATRNVGPAQAALQYRMDNGLTTVFHNSPFDLHCLEQRGLRVNWNTVQDTLLMARLANNLGQHDLGALGETVLGVPRDQKDVVKAWLAKNSRTFQKQYGRKPNFLDVPDDTLLPYAAHDTALTIGLYYALIGQCPPALLQKEMRLREEMFKAERAGVEIDPLLVNQKLMQVKAEQGQIDQMLEYQYGGPVKPDSDAFLRDWLFKQLKLNPVGFTEGGQPQVNEYSLTSNPHPVTRLIIAHNKRVKGPSSSSRTSTWRMARSCTRPSTRFRRAPPASLVASQTYSRFLHGTTASRPVRYSTQARAGSSGPTTTNRKSSSPRVRQARRF
jgi:DNA polymerase I-like protein with 3'-5' exonuclease and polymerase domains